MPTDRQSDVRPERLYQYRPYKEGFPPNVEHEVGSWTWSLESYRISARRRFYLLVNNYKEGREYRIVSVNYLEEFFILDLREQFRLIKAYLQEQGITAYTISELTTDGPKYNRPTNCLHRHFIIDSPKPERYIRRAFNGACQHAGLQRKVDYRVSIEPPILNKGDFMGAVGQRTLRFFKGFFNILPISLRLSLHFLFKPTKKATFLTAHATVLPLL
jgi:hypothetical protein